MARLGRGRVAEPRREHGGGRGQDHGAHEQERVAPRPPEDDRAGRGDEQDDGLDPGVTGAEVPCDRAQVAEHRQRPPQLRAARPDADVEPAGEHEVRPPERDGQYRHGHEGTHGVAQVPLAREHVDALRRQDERAVRVRGDREQHREAPERPAAPAAMLGRREKREVRQAAREEEEAVHAPVDAVEQHHPTRGRERGRRQPGRAAGEPVRDRGDQRDAPDREHGGDEPQPDEAAAGVGDDPGEQEVERRAAALVQHRREEVAEVLPADEEHERLVLVRWPRGEVDEHEHRHRRGARADAERVPVRVEIPLGSGLQGQRGGLYGHGPLVPLRISMPIYEYRCPNGHLFELFQRMTDDPPERCEVCDAGPVERVLHPVAVHYKGSGFYTTDYGKGSKRGGASKDGDSSSSPSSGDSGSSAPSSDSGSGGDKKKPAEA